MKINNFLILVSLIGTIYLLPLAFKADFKHFSLKAKNDQSIVVDNNLVAQNLDQVTEAYLWQNDDLLKKYSRAQLRRNIPIDSDGAMGNNRKDRNNLQVGWQRQAFEAIAYGISTKNILVIEKGISGFRWAFARQDENGLFGKSQYPEVISFLGAYARSILLLRQSGYIQEADSLSAYIPKMEKTLNNPLLLSEEAKFEANEANQKVTNQLFWVALSYKTIHLIQPNSRLNDKAEAWLKEGLNRQRLDGSFPEKDGSDTHYQSWSLELLSLYTFYSPKDKNLISPYLKKGFEWLSSKILPDGTMDIRQNTRTQGNQERNPQGRFKDGRMGRPISYIYWSYLGGNKSAKDLAIKLSNGSTSARR